MASLKLQLPLLLISLSVLSTVSQPESSPTPPQSIINAAETLANSGYTAMSLTLQLIAPTLPLPSSDSPTALTIFSPPDDAFSNSGQPPLSLLLLHFSPLTLSPASLLSLPFASTIPSLSPSKHLFITSDSDQPKQISINNVKVHEPPIFDDGFAIVYAIDNFFTLSFTLATADPPSANPKSNFQCLKLESTSRFEEASGVLRSRGYSIIADFLDLQMTGYLGRSEDDDVTNWTVFAPVDGDLVPFSGELFSYSSLLMRHLAPCRVEYSVLEEMANGTVVSNSVNGLSLEITRDEIEESVMVNGVEITAPDLYKSDWLVIHGILGLIPKLNGDYDGDGANIS
ncbi:hypothetical protein CASFOL_020546 [Castilleja foliolosa]|uniref:FAS1 domain-containing protein n=1 Tax=Castilleja foliolosa TaxID=1961234 RepID=A0ABD3D2G7_9LAMI